MNGQPHSLVSLRRSAGVGLVTAIFLLVVLAGLAVAMVSLFATQQISTALDEQGARAYQAARAGVEWGVYRQLRLGATCASITTGGTTTSFVMPSGTSLSAFTVTVTCKKIDNADPDLVRYVITAIACNERGAPSCPVTTNSPGYVQRQVEVEI